MCKENLRLWSEANRERQEGRKVLVQAARRCFKAAWQRMVEEQGIGE